MEKIFTKKLISSWFNSNADITIRNVTIKDKTINIFYIECLINKTLLSQNILAPLCELEKADSKEIYSKLAITELSQPKTKAQVQSEILNGAVVVFIEGDTTIISSNIAGYSTRAITEPPTSQVAKGPREGFVEDMHINISMLRRRLKSHNLAIEKVVVGKQTHTNISLMYMKNIADIGQVKKITKKLKAIDIDGIIDSYYVESLLEEGKLKFIRRVGNSEKPDVIASRILEGRIAIIVDGSPIVLTLPFLILEDIQSSEDYYTIPARASLLRGVRLIGLILGFLLPGIYVGLQSYHYRVLPLNFLVTLLSSIDGISFPPLIEILVVLFLFEILAEASARMPKLLGMALSIIGALILGETAIKAGILSPTSIVVVAISSIMLFIVPDEVSQVSLLRILFTFIGGIAGFYGMLMAFIILTTYLITSSGFGTPLLAPYAPSISTDKQDGIIKQPLTNIKKRPLSISTKNIIRHRTKRECDE